MGGIILRRHNQTSALLGASIDDLNDVDQILLVVDVEVQFIIVSCAKITHHVLVPPEEHNRTHVVKLVHLVEVLDDGVVAGVDDSKISNLVGNLVEHFVLGPSVFVFWVAEADYHYAFVFRHAGLINVPRTGQVVD